MSIASVPPQPLPVGVWDLALSPLEDASRPAAVARRIEQAIALGLIAEGSPLPPEADLATQMNVSLMTLRSSLATLRDKGLIETRRGRTGGNFVVLPDDPDQQPLRQRLLELDIDAIRDRRDYYTGITGKSAELAADRARGHTLERLRAASTSIRAAATAADAVRLDSRFHLELAASTRSAMITQAEIAAQNDITPLLWIPGLECCTPEDCEGEHSAIVAAVEQRDAVGARMAAELHVAKALNGLIEVRMRLG